MALEKNTRNPRETNPYTQKALKELERAKLYALNYSLRQCEMVIRENETKTTSSSNQWEVETPQNGAVLTLEDVLVLEAT